MKVRMKTYPSIETMTKSSKDVPNLTRKNRNEVGLAAVVLVEITIKILVLRQSNGYEVTKKSFIKTNQLSRKQAL